MSLSLQWWAYMIMAAGLFLGCLALNYLVKLMNDNRLEERINRLYEKTSTSTQVQVSEIDSNKSAPNNETQLTTGISLVFSKEANKHKFIDLSFDRIAEETKSLDNSSKILGTLFSNKKFSSHGSFSRLEGISSSNYAKAKFARKNQTVRIVSPNESTESTLAPYKIKESNAVQDLKANTEILLPIDYIIHGDVNSKNSLHLLPEHLFKDPDDFESKSECVDTDIPDHDVKAEKDYSIQSADDASTIKANESDVKAFQGSNKTLQADAVSNVSSVFNPGNIHCLGHIYNDTYVLPKDSVKSIINKKSHESGVDFIKTKASLINYDHDNNPCTSSAVPEKNYFHNVYEDYSDSSVCKDIVEDIVNKLDESEVLGANIEGLEDADSMHE